MVIRDPCSVQAGRSPLLSQPRQPRHHIRSNQSFKQARTYEPAQITPLQGGRFGAHFVPGNGVNTFVIMIVVCLVLLFAYTYK